MSNLEDIFAKDYSAFMSQDLSITRGGIQWPEGDTDTVWRKKSKGARVYEYLEKARTNQIRRALLCVTIASISFVIMVLQLGTVGPIISGIGYLTALILLPFRTKK